MGWWKCHQVVSGIGYSSRIVVFTNPRFNGAITMHIGTGEGMAFEVGKWYLFPDSRDGRDADPASIVYPEGGDAKGD